MLPIILDGIAEVARQHHWFIVDQWGVLHDGYRAHPGAIDALRRLREVGPVALVSNTSQRIGRAQEALGALGFSEDLYDACFTAGELAARWLMARPEAVVYSLGDPPPPLLAELACRTTRAIAEADVVLAGLTWRGPRHAPRAELEAAAAQGLPLLCANPDVRSIQPDGSFIWCPGAAADDYAKMGGEVHHFGKPKAAMYDAARAALGVDDGRVGPRGLAFGDSLAHDVRGAHEAGIPIVFLTRGIHGPELGLRTTDPPNAGAIRDLALRYDTFVNYASPVFQW